MAFTMNQAQYARHRGISGARVNILIKQGKLDGSFRKKKGKILIDPALADSMLKINLDKMNPPKEKQVTDEKVSEEEKQKTVAEANLSGFNYHKARTVNEQYKAALRKIEYEERIGKLIQSMEIEKALSGHILSAKVRLEGLKSKIMPVVIEYVADQTARESIAVIVDACVREAMEELSRDVV